MDQDIAAVEVRRRNRFGRVGLLGELSIISHEEVQVRKHLLMLCRRFQAAISGHIVSSYHICLQHALIGKFGGLAAV
jgi:hypothetical protein